MSFKFEREHASDQRFVLQEKTNDKDFALNFKKNEVRLFVSI